jgi:hypothetical protein
MQERLAMFRLAVPELRLTELKPVSYELIGAFRSLRVLGQKLWTATTEVEALELVGEYSTIQFGSDVIVGAVRDESGCWNDHSIVGKSDAHTRMEMLTTLLKTNLDTVHLDEVHFTTIIAQPGDVLARADQPPSQDREFVEKVGPALISVGWPDLDFMLGRVRSKRGFMASIAVLHETSHDHTDVDREHLSAISQLVSLALSG